jgi:hypothetical protein
VIRGRPDFDSVRTVTATTQKFGPKVAALLMLLTGCTAHNRVLEEVFEKVYAAEPDTSISIHNRDGAVLVYGGAPNEIRVQSIKKAYSSERLNQIAIDVSTKPRVVSVTTKFPTLPKWGFLDRSGVVDYTIVVPKTASISVLELNAGEIHLDSMRGQEARVRLNDGRIFARNCFTNLDLATMRGMLTLTYDWWEQEKFSAHAHVGQGNAWVFLPTESAFHLLAHAANGRISNDFNRVPLTQNSSAGGMKVDQIVNGGGSAVLDIRVDNGRIKVGEANP